MLNGMVATTLDLAMQTKLAHWNTRGPSFIARHELFDEANRTLRELMDRLAERAGVLGGYARGGVRFAASESELPDYDHDATTGEDHIRTVIARFALFAGSLRRGIERAGELDPATEDLLIGALRDIELMMWKLESHLIPTSMAAPVKAAIRPVWVAGARPPAPVASMELDSGARQRHATVGR